MANDPDPNERLLAETAWLVRLARCLVAGREAADDVVQETLLRALSAPLAGVQNLRAWLAVVAANVARRFARQAHRQQRHARRLPGRDPEPSVADAVSRTEAQQRVMAALLAMPEPYRSVLLLRFQAGFGYAAIAAELGLPLETVRTQIKRGLQQLRTTLDERAGGRAAWAAPLVGGVGRAVVLALAPVAVAAGVCIGCAVVIAPALDVPMVAPVGQVVAIVDDVLPEVVAATTGPDARELVPMAEPAAAPPAIASSSAGSDAAVAVGGVAGRVLDAHTRLPIAGAEIGLGNRFVHSRRADEAGSLLAKQAPAAFTVSAADGSFFVPGAKDEGTQLSVRAVGYPPLELFPARVALVAKARPLEAASKPRPPLVAAGTLELGDVLLARAAWSRVEVVTAAGARAPGAELFTFSVAGTLRWEEPLGRADAEGTWVGVLPRMDGASTFLVALHAGTTASIAATVGQDHRLVLGRPAALRVHVVDELGVPIAGAQVIAEPEWQPMARELGIVSGTLWRRLRTVVASDAAGQAMVPQLPCLPATPHCHLLVTADGHRGEARTVSLPAPADAVHVVLPRGESETVRGRVVDADTLQPIARAMVGQSGVTDALGRFELAGFDLRLGSLRLDVSAHRYVSVRIDEPVGGRMGGIDLEVRLRPAVHCQALVVDARGRPLRGVRVNGHAGREAVSGADGRLLLGGVPRGRFTVRVEPAVGPPLGVVPFVVEVDSTAAIVITVPDAGS
ncbi:MAG: sigma-70 family RNA polymerase sigma factor [Planctomycetes bacterium]|jgi:RNA polymerase sigma-70 factor (ECF subfamily)|nr:sigma-70 family RNA polymerase sigma factor [Planctomycetota bacterium]